MSIVREGFKPYSIGTNGTLVTSSAYLGGFLAKTTGTITITILVGNHTGLSTVTILDAIPVTAGIYTPIPAYFVPVQNGCTITLGAGAAGTLFA